MQNPLKSTASSHEACSTIADNPATFCRSTILSYLFHFPKDSRLLVARRPKENRSNQGGSESRSPNAGVLHVLLPMRMRRKRPAPCDRLQVGRGFNRLLAPGLATHVGAFFEGRGECLYEVHAWTSTLQHRCMSFGAFLSSCTNSFRTSLMLSESSTIFVMYSGTSQRCFAAPVARHGAFRVWFGQYSRIFNACVAPQLCAE